MKISQFCQFKIFTLTLKLKYYIYTLHSFFDFFAGLQLYLDQKTPVLEEDPVLINNRKNKHHGHGGNGNNPSLGNSGSGSLGPAEMGLKQFSTITDLLVKLKDDLTLSFPSFIREFIGKMHSLKKYDQFTLNIS